MHGDPMPAVKRAMKVQQGILKAISGQFQWWQAAEILGVFCRTMRRRCPSPRKLPLATVQQVLHLYREQYQGFNVAHFCDQLREHHDLTVSYQWVKTALQTAGLVAPRVKRDRHHQRRPRPVLQSVHRSRQPFLPHTQRRRAGITTVAAEMGDAIFCVQHERTVAADNTVTVGKLRLQIAPQSTRWSYAQCRIKVCEQLDGRWSVRYGPGSGLVWG